MSGQSGLHSKVLSQLIKINKSSNIYRFLILPFFSKLQHSSYLQSNYIISSITSNLGISSRIEGDMHRPNANTMPFYRRD